MRHSNSKRQIHMYIMTHFIPFYSARTISPHLREKAPHRTFHAAYNPTYISFRTTFYTSISSPKGSPSTHTPSSIRIHSSTLLPQHHLRTGSNSVNEKAKKTSRTHPGMCKGTGTVSPNPAYAVHYSARSSEFQKYV